MHLEIYRLATIGNGILAAMPCPIIDSTGSEPFAGIAKQGFRHVVSLLEAGEARQLGLEAEGELVRAQSLEFTAFPIPDLGLPPSLPDFAQLTLEIWQQVNAGTSTLVHCRAGVGRSGLVAAGILLQAGLDLEPSLRQISACRGARVPETPAQLDWLQNRLRPYLQQQPAAAACKRE